MDTSTPDLTLQQELALLYRDVQPHELHANTCRMPWLVPTNEAPKDADAINLGSGMSLLIGLWRPNALPDPLTPPMSSAEYASLKASIRRHGVLQACLMTPDGRVLDGYHRLTAIADLLEEGLSVRYPFARFVAPASPAAEAALAVAMNASRRMLSIKDRREMARKLLKAEHDGTDGLLAELVGLDAETVRSIRQELEAEGQIPIIETRRDRRGRRHQVAPKRARTPKPAKKAQQDAANESDGSDVGLTGTASCRDESTQGTPAEADAVAHSLPAEAGLLPKIGSTVEHEGDPGQTEEHPESKATTAPHAATRTCEAAPVEMPTIDPVLTIIDVQIRGVAPEGAELAKEFLARVLPRWWLEHGFLPVTAAMLLQLEPLGVANEFRGDATRVIGCLMGAVNGRQINGYRITTHRIGGMTSTLYVLAPATWSKHGPEAD